jgi:hypothetical protein
MNKDHDGKESNPPTPNRQSQVKTPAKRLNLLLHAPEDPPLLLSHWAKDSAEYWVSSQIAINVIGRTDSFQPRSQLRLRPGIWIWRTVNSSKERNTAFQLTTFGIFLCREHIPTPDIPHRNCCHDTCETKEQVLRSGVRECPRSMVLLRTLDCIALSSGVGMTGNGSEEFCRCP